MKYTLSSMELSDGKDLPEMKNKKKKKLKVTCANMLQLWEEHNPDFKLQFIPRQSYVLYYIHVEDFFEEKVLPKISLKPTIQKSGFVSVIYPKADTS